MGDILYSNKQLRRKWYALLRSDCLRPAEKKLVCVEWSDFARFVEDVGFPSDGATCLCMIDARQGFRPGNVRWGTFRERLRARRHYKLLTHNGHTMSVSEWAREIGICRKALAQRLSRYPVDLALGTPRISRKARSPLTHLCQTMSLTAWARAVGICHKTMAQRVARHSSEKAIAAPKQRRGGGKPLEQSLAELLSPQHRSTPCVSRTKFRCVFDNEGAIDSDSDEMLAMKWLEAHCNNVGKIQHEFTLMFGTEVAARAVAYCTEITIQGSGHRSDHQK